MAAKKYNITRADAVAYAMEHCVDNPDVIEVLASLHKQYSKVRSTAGEETATHKANASLARTVKKAIEDAGITEPVSGKWIVDNVVGIDHPQKATAVMKVGIEIGLFEKHVIPNGSRNTILYSVK